MRQKGFHHVAYACRDVESTRHFYEDLMGFPLVHTETEAFDPPPGVDGPKGFMRHLFFDAGGGEAIAFFDVHQVGEKPTWRSDVSTGNGLPVWVNHCAFWATEDDQTETKARMAVEGVKPLMEIDHGWCHSVYFVDPNGIMVELCRDTPGLPMDPRGARAGLTWTPG
jgi:catechol 2,3-dioxygenase-like lactoylglutathione lyase family enzyme